MAAQNRDAIPERRQETRPDMSDRKACYRTSDRKSIDSQPTLCVVSLSDYELTLYKVTIHQASPSD